MAKTYPLCRGHFLDVDDGEEINDMNVRTFVFRGSGGGDYEQADSYIEVGEKKGDWERVEVIEHSGWKLRSQVVGFIGFVASLWALLLFVELFAASRTSSTTWHMEIYNCTGPADDWPDSHRAWCCVELEVACPGPDQPLLIVDAADAVANATDAAAGAAADAADAVGGAAVDASDAVAEAAGDFVKTAGEVVTAGAGVGAGPSPSSATDDSSKSVAPAPGQLRRGGKTGVQAPAAPGPAPVPEAAPAPAPNAPAAGSASTTESPVPTTTPLYECTRGFSEVWPMAKAEWCCTNTGVGCHQSTLPPFDCTKDTEGWYLHWSVAKSSYCCQAEGIACGSPLQQQEAVAVPTPPPQVAVLPDMFTTQATTQPPLPPPTSPPTAPPTPPPPPATPASTSLAPAPTTAAPETTPSLPAAAPTQAPTAPPSTTAAQTTAPPAPTEVPAETALPMPTMAPEESPSMPSDNGEIGVSTPSMPAELPIPVAPAPTAPPAWPPSVPAPAPYAAPGNTQAESGNVEMLDPDGHNHLYGAAPVRDMDKGDAIVFERRLRFSDPI